MRIQSLLAVAALVVAPLLVTVGTASAAPAAPPLVISPNPAGPGDDVVFSGSGCFGQGSNPAQVTLYVVDAEVTFAGDSSKKFAAADDEGDPVITPKADGTWSYSETLPDQIPSADITFGAVCDSYTDSFQYKPATLEIDGDVSATFMVLPDFLYTKAVLDAGHSYEVDAFGFQPGEKVRLILHSAPVQIATFAAADDSTVAGEFTVPIDTLGGAHTLEMVGEDSGLTASLPIEVVAAPVSPTVIVTTTTVSTLSTTPQATSVTPTTGATSAPTTSVIAGPVLASTGVSAVPQMTGVGLALTFGGVGSLLFARRRRSRSH